MFAQSSAHNLITLRNCLSSFQWNKTIIRKILTSWCFTIFKTRCYIIKLHIYIYIYTINLLEYTVIWSSSVVESTSNYVGSYLQECRLYKSSNACLISRVNNSGWGEYPTLNSNDLCVKWVRRVTRRVNKIKGYENLYTERRYVISIPNDNVCRCLMIRSGCEAWRLVLGRLYIFHIRRFYC